MALKAQNEGVRSVAFGSITNSFANLGNVTSNPAYSITIFNGTDAQIQISKDGGTSTWLDIPPLGAISRDYANSNQFDSIGLVPTGIQFQIKYSGSAPTSGTTSITLEYLEIT